MAEGRSRAEWSHTASILALIANTNRDKRKKPTPFTPADFNPWSKRKDIRIPVKGVRVLKQVFVKDPERSRGVDGRKSQPGQGRKGSPGESSGQCGGG